MAKRAPGSVPVEEDGYVEIDLRMKQKAVAATAVLQLTQGKFPKGDLLTWLAGIGDL